MKIGEEADEVIKKINNCRNNKDLNIIKENYKNKTENSIDLNEFFIEQETRIAFGCFQSSKTVEGNSNEFLSRKRKGDPTGFVTKLTPTSPKSISSNSNKEMATSPKTTEVFSLILTLR